MATSVEEVEGHGKCLEELVRLLENMVAEQRKQLLTKDFAAAGHKEKVFRLKMEVSVPSADVN